jgi:hypothetical protein
MSLAPLLLGCAKSSASSGAEPVTSAAPSAASTAEAAAPSTIEVWTGSYESKPGPLYVFDGGEWAGVTWRGDDAGVALGSGTLRLSVDSKSGGVQGTADGAFGSVVVIGRIAEGQLAATVERKDPTDRGLTGILTAKVTASSIAGSIHVSSADARVIRVAEFSLSRGKP